MILVTGARSVVGTPLCWELNRQDIPFLGVSRALPESGDIPNVRWNMSQPISDDIANRMNGIDTVIHCAPLWFLPHNMQKLIDMGAKKFIAFGSTSVKTKKNSLTPWEQDIVDKLERSERSIKAIAEENGIQAVILRPTMIYGHGLDQNVSRIATFMKKRRFLIVGGKADGKRQPVHTDDLIQAALTLAKQESFKAPVYELAGAEVLTYKTMAKRISKAMGRPPIIIHIPTFIYQSLLKGAARFGNFNYTADMGRRMARDMTFDISPAQRDFGYSPQKFLTKPHRDLIT